MKPCPDCDGSGVVGGDYFASWCSRCGGSGEIEDDE